MDFICILMLFFLFFSILMHFVKHFELPVCMKSAIKITLPCLTKMRPSSKELLRHSGATMDEQTGVNNSGFNCLPTQRRDIQNHVFTGYFCSTTTSKATGIIEIISGTCNLSWQVTLCSVKICFQLVWKKQTNKQKTMLSSYFALQFSPHPFLLCSGCMNAFDFPQAPVYRNNK